jgi:hypothetical protein
MEPPGRSSSRHPDSQRLDLGRADGRDPAQRADWQIVRPEGALEIDGPYSARTADGALLYLRVTGLRTGPASALEVIETSAAGYTHPQDYLFVASCVREATSSSTPPTV